MSNKTKKFHILINEQSGTVSRLGREHIEKLIQNSDLPIETLHFLKPEKFFQELKNISDDDNHILIGGGDGTIKSAANILQKSKKPFGVLPMGTMNLFATDLGIPQDFEKALKTHTNNLAIAHIDIGMLNDHPFLCCVGIGTMPEASEFREENREQPDELLMPRLTIFMLNQMDKVKHRLMRISLDGKIKKIKTAALVISNNKYQPVENNIESENNFIRPSLHDGELGIYSAAPKSLWAKLRLILNLKFGNWRNDPVIKEWSAETASLRTKNKEELVSLDGETETIQTPLNFWIEKEALPVLIPISK